MTELFHKMHKSPALVGLFFVLLAGCQKPETPDQVTLAFWQKVASGDLNRAEQYLVKDGKTTLQPIEKLAGAQFSIGQIVIEQNQAQVETIATKGNNSNAQPTIFTTYLVNQQQWRIDYARTHDSLNNRLFNGLIDSLKEFGENLNKQLEQQVPLLEKEMETFGEKLKHKFDQLVDDLEKSLPADKRTDPYAESI